MNPTDTTQSAPALQDIPGGFPNAPFAIPPGAVLPNGITSDAIVQSFVNVLQQEVGAANQYALNSYHGQLAMWNSNNQHGIFGPAPGAVVLTIVNPNAAAAYEITGKGGAAVLMRTTYWEVPPGLILQAPAQATPIPQPVNPIGLPIIGTSNLYTVNAGDTHINGDIIPDAQGNKYMKLASPFGDAVWRKL